MSAAPLTSLERYELVDRIAVGGMAEVYRAVAYGAHGFEKNLAIKRILPELASDPEFEERFIGEAKLAVNLTHANLVQVLDFGRLAGSLFIAMELVDGLDLAALLRFFNQHSELVAVPAALHMAIEMSRGLDYAHQHGVVHRDVSPSNILISRAGEVKIADFGIAQAAGDRAAIASDKRRIMGKWRYMSPEQTRGEPLEPRSDIFSAAAVLFELFTGDKLFPGDDADTIIQNICTMEIPPASRRRPGLPERLDEVFERALERDPANRPTAAEMLRALVEISYESTIVASALDVSSCVAEVWRRGGGPRVSMESRRRKRPSGIDALIRQQLGNPVIAAGEPSESTELTRKTAVASAEPLPEETAFATTARAEPAGDGETGISIVRSGIDSDGVTHWKMDHLTIAAGPKAKREGRASDPPPVESDSDSGSATESATDSVTASTRRRWPLKWLAVAALALVGGGFVAWRALAPTDRGAAPVPVALPADAAPGPRPATLAIDSIPAGARVTIDGQPVDGVTPVSLTVEPDSEHELTVELDGYQAWTQSFTATASERVRIVAPLVARRATLRVTTRPPGATVELDGEPIGQTPLSRNDLRPGSGRSLVLRKTGFHPITVPIDLVEHSPLDIERRLESAISYGRINVNITNSWAEVSLAGKSIGRVPGPLRLPVGNHRLRLYNPVSKKQKNVRVEVYPDQVKTYEFEL